MLLELPATDTFDDWCRLGEFLASCEKQLKWKIGAWLIDGSERFGERASEQALRIFRGNETKFFPIVQVCQRFPADKRHALPFSHHAAVMGVQDDAEAHQLLTRAEHEGLTTAALKAQVRVTTSRQASIADWSDDTIEDREYRAIVQAWNRASTEAARRMFAEVLEDVGMGEIEL